MESTVLGVVLDSSVLIAAERSELTPPEVMKAIQSAVGNLPILISSLTVAELGHGIYRAKKPERSQQRRRFLDEVKSQISIRD